MASSTGCSSFGEREITPSTFDVAVWYSRVSETSRVLACTSSNSRVFSMAITAWSAKVSTSSTCLAVNGLTTWRARNVTPITSPVRSSGTASIVRALRVLLTPVVGKSGIGKRIVHVDRLAFSSTATCRQLNRRSQRIGFVSSHSRKVGSGVAAGRDAIDPVVGSV